MLIIASNIMAAGSSAASFHFRLNI
jgi:hypothetical protein